MLAANTTFLTPDFNPLNFKCNVPPSWDVNKQVSYPAYEVKLYKIPVFLSVTIQLFNTEMSIPCLRKI